MTYPQQPGGWSDPSGSPTYIDPVTGQPAYPTSPGGYPQSPGEYPNPGGYQQNPYVPTQPAYGGAYPAYAPVMVPARSTNGMAIASLVLSLSGLMTCGVISIVGAILGHVARRQIRERGDGGEGMALAGVIIGWVAFGLGVVGTVLFVLLIRSAANNLPNTYPTY
jgi:hypothetical protein